MSGTRTTTLAGRLARMGFGDARRAERLVTSDLALDVSPGERPGTIPGFGGPPKDEAVLEAIAAAADPDLALLGLATIIGADRETDATPRRTWPRSGPRCAPNRGSGNG